jgi:hypothetical protein
VKKTVATYVQIRGTSTEGTIKLEIEMRKELSLRLLAEEHNPLTKFLTFWVVPSS